MRTISFRALGLVSLLAAGIGLSTVSAAPAKNFAVGGGSLVDEGNNAKHFAFSAHDGPNGPSGHAVVTQVSAAFGDFELQGHVTCVSVSGNQASIGVQIEKGSGTAEGQSGIFLFVEDNGNGGSGVPDQFNNSGYVGDTSVCPPPGDPVTEVDSGNINVN